MLETHGCPAALGSGSQSVTGTARALDRVPVVTLPDDYWRDRGPYLARLYAEHGPIVGARLGQVPVFFLLGPEANRFVLQTHRDAFSNRLGWDWVFGKHTEPPNLITMDSPEHDRHRRLLHPAFAVRGMQRYMPLLARVIDRRLSGWAGRGEVDLYEEARVITFDAVAVAFLGIRPGSELTLCRAVFLHGAHRRWGEFAALLRAKVEDRRARPVDDAIGLLALARSDHDRPLTDAQIQAQAEVLLIAGHETSASLGAWSLYALIAHPAYAQRVLDEAARLTPSGKPTAATLREMPVLDRAISEAERLYAPVPTAPRVAVRPIEFAGHCLPAGTRVLYAAAATHLLPEIWTAPESFDPDRFAPPREEHKRVSYALVGFGGGPRTCIGRTFARIELALFLLQALHRFELTIVSGQTIVQRYGVTNRPLHGIRMQVRRRATLNS